jgi:hypothetical protein
LDDLIKELTWVYFRSDDLPMAAAYKSLRGTTLGAAQAQNAQALQDVIKAAGERERELSIIREKYKFAIELRATAHEMPAKVKEALLAQMELEVYEIYLNNAAGARLKAALDKCDKLVAEYFPEVRAATALLTPSSPINAPPCTPGAATTTGVTSITPEAPTGGERHDLTPEMEMRDVSSAAALADLKRKGTISEQEATGLPALGHIDAAKIEEQSAHKFGTPLFPETPRKPVALPYDGSTSFTFKVLIAVVTLADLVRSHTRGVIQGQDTKAKPWKLFSFFVTLPSGETAKILYWGDMADEARAAVGRTIDSYVAANCTRLAFIFKANADAANNTFGGQHGSCSAAQRQRPPRH